MTLENLRRFGIWGEKTIANKLNDYEDTSILQKKCFQLSNAKGSRFARG